MYNDVLIECANLALFGVDDAAAGVIIGSIIGGIVNFVGNLINSSSTKNTNKDNISATQAENEKAREFEETMYNKYESIPAQAQQFREAGLNPIQAVSPQSIGHASTAPIPQSQSPQFGNALIESFPAFLEAGTTLRQQRIQRQEEINKELENWKLAFENGTAEEQYRLQKQEIQSRIALNRTEKRKRSKEIEQLDLTYRMAKEAYDSGINPFKDEHDKFVAELEKIKEDTSLTKSQREIAQHTLTLSQKFDEKFLQLDYDERKTAVDEYLANSENRKEFNQLSHELYTEIQKLAKSELKDVKAKLQAVDAMLAEDLLNSAINDKWGRFDTVILKWFQSNPGGLVQLASQFIPNVTYAPKTVNPTKIITGK